MKSKKTIIKKVGVILLLFTGCFFISCSNESKAKKVIKEELRLTLHDYKSYEPVKFDSLKVANSSFEDLPEYILSQELFKKYLKASQDYADEADLYHISHSTDKFAYYVRLSKEQLDSAKVYLDKGKAIGLGFIPQPNGWKMIHSFRAKSLGGNLGIHHKEFYFDKEIKKVTKIVDLTEKE